MKERVKAGQTIRLWKAVLSCIRQKTKYIDKMVSLATELKVINDEYVDISYNTVRVNLTTARKSK